MLQAAILFSINCVPNNRTKSVQLPQKVSGSNKTKADYSRFTNSRITDHFTVQIHSQYCTQNNEIKQTKKNRKINVKVKVKTLQTRNKRSHHKRTFLGSLNILGAIP
jgi:hypothetical protein